MRISYQNLALRQATADDAKLLSGWWNSPAVMAFSRYPKGRRTTPERVARQIARESGAQHRRLILELDNTPIGEMYFKFRSAQSVEIGIKIADLSKQNQGYGKQLVSMLINYLFEQTKAEKIIATTEIKNLRAQHQLERLGFQHTKTNANDCKNQLGEVLTYLIYELRENQFINFAK